MAEPFFDACLDASVVSRSIVWPTYYRNHRLRVVRASNIDVEVRYFYHFIYDDQNIKRRELGERQTYVSIVIACALCPFARVSAMQDLA